MAEEEEVQAAEPAEENKASAAGGVQSGSVSAAPATAESAKQEDVSYQAVEKEGVVTAIWEMQGQKHLRPIAPRPTEGKQILALLETAG